MSKLYNSGLKLYANTVKHIKIKIKVLKLIYLFLNFLNAVLTTSISILAALIISQQVFKESYPLWFIYISSGTTALIILLTSSLNFFLIKERLISAKKQIVQLVAEKTKYDLKISKWYQEPDNDYKFYLRISSIMNNEASQKEVKLV